MKGKQEYDTKPGYFPYCRTHNRLYIHAISLWLTPRETTGFAVLSGNL